MMTIDEMIAVLTHAKNGGKVQGRNHYSTEWQDFVDGCKPRWDFPACDYRAKPEPLVIYAEVLQNGRIVSYGLANSVCGGTVKKFVEVAE